MFTQNKRFFSDAAVATQDEPEPESIEDTNARIGVDTVFSKQKHAYVLTFPWNFDEIIDEFQAKYPEKTGFWSTYVKNSESLVEFNDLYRRFHQACALHDPEGIDAYCEPRLAQAVNESLDRIHFHGLDIEMANLTVTQPSIKVLKVEIAHGLNVDRDTNGNAEDWTTTESSFYGAPCTYYTPVKDERSIFDFLDETKKPYNVAVTALIESPMKLYVQNQNFSSILLGNDNDETVKNVVRFETNLRWSDLYDLVPTENKPEKRWKITDWNNLMNENKHFA